MNPKLLLFLFCLGSSVPVCAQYKTQGSSKGNAAVKKTLQKKQHKPPKHTEPTKTFVEPAPLLKEASVFFVDSFFRKDRVREVNSSGYVLSPLGEAFIYRNELKRGRPYRQWLLYRNEDKTFFVVDPLAEAAVRTPKIIFPQSLQAPADIACKAKDQEGASIDSLFEDERILGYKTQKCSRVLSDGSKLEQWIAVELTVPMSPKSRMADALNKFRLPDNPEYGERAGCLVFREKKFDSTGKLVYSRNIKHFDLEHAEQRFFDLRGFGVSDILTGWVVKDPEPEEEKKKK
jgi:hypothetical protein